MKQILFTIFSFLIFISCEKDNIEISPNASVNIQTKRSRIANPIDQLRDMQVNIRLVADTRYCYLSGSPSNTAVNRHDWDDGSERQRWYIKSRTGGISYNMMMVGGAKVNGEIAFNGGPGEFNPFLNNGLPLDVFKFENVPNTNFYNIVYAQPFKEKLYLYAIGDRDVTVKKIDNNKDSKAIWEIIPVEDLELIDIKYEPIAGKKFTPVPELRQTIDVPNPTGITVLQQFNISEQVTETSSFSNVEGITTTYKITTKGKVGLPIIADGEVSTENTTAKTWSYQETNTESRVRTISHVFTMELPPYAHYLIDVMMVIYNIDINYIATFKGKITGTIIQLKGKWEGVECKGLSYKPRDITGKPVVISGLKDFDAPLE